MTSAFSTRNYSYMRLIQVESLFVLEGHEIINAYDFLWHEPSRAISVLMAFEHFLVYNYSLHLNYSRIMLCFFSLIFIVEKEVP